MKATVLMQLLTHNARIVSRHHIGIIQPTVTCSEGIKAAAFDSSIKTIKLWSSRTIHARPQCPCHRAGRL